MRTNASFRARMQEPDPLNAMLLCIPNSAVATILGDSGVDFVVVDGEHGAYTTDSLLACVNAVAWTSAASVIRVGGNDPVLIKQALDLGPDGVQVPMVNTAEEARAAVRAAKYGPMGFRGVGPGRAARYGPQLEHTLATANDEVAVIVMVETAEGVENAAEIAAVEGVDGIFVGPLDLSNDLGLPGQVHHDRVMEANARVVEAGKAAGKKVGVGGPQEDVALWRDRGADLFMCFIDVVALSVTAKASADEVRSLLAAK
jgi:4-hydroxy-2-oxoheptanedioate aldolase